MRLDYGEIEMKAAIKNAVDNIYNLYIPKSKGIGGPSKTKKLDNDLVWKAFLTYNKDAQENEDDFVFEGIGSNTSLDLYDEYMTNEVIDGFANEINSAYAAGKPLNMYSNHDFRWENGIAKLVWATNENGNLKYKAIADKSHPLFPRLKHKLENGFRVENSVAIVRVKTEFDEKREQWAITNAKLKTVDVVGLGANEETETNAKSAQNTKSGFYHVPKGIFDDLKKNGVENSMDIFGKKKKKEATPDNKNDGEAEATQPTEASKEAIDALKAAIAQKLEEDMENTMKEVKETAIQAFKEAFNDEAKNQVMSLVDAHLAGREKKALNTDAVTEKKLEELQELNSDQQPEDKVFKDNNLGVLAAKVMKK